MQQSHSFGDSIITGLVDAPSRANLSRPPSSPPPPPPLPPISISHNPNLNPPSRDPPGLDGITPVPRSVFSSVRLPRSSSLIHPSHVSQSPTRATTATTATHTTAATTATSTHTTLPPASIGNNSGNPLHQTHRDTVHPPVSLKRPSTPSSHPSRGTTTGASPQQGSRSRNRWSTSSVSSTSSRTSPYASHQASGSHSHYHSNSNSSYTRRASIEAVVGASHGSSALAAAQAPQNLHRADRSHFALPDRSATPTRAYPMRSESSMSMRHYESSHLRSMSPNPYANPAVTTQSTARMPHEQNRDPYAPRGHSRDNSSKSSRDMGKPRAQKNPSQKAMLSRALQKANTAVQLDNAQNFEGAREAYAEACDLLQQVLDRTSGDEDKRKLEAIVSLVSQEQELTKIFINIEFAAPNIHQPYR